MDPAKISDHFSVSPQISPEDVPDIAAAGFRSILCNRPDGEEFGQTACTAIETVAQAAGLEFRNVPIVSGMLSEADVDDFKAALAELPGPVLAYCRSGTRCTMLWTIAKHGEVDEAEILRATEAAGYDMRGLVAQMSRG